MPEIHASESAVIAAPPRTVYAIVADYHQGHPAILPPKYFGELVVEAGGVGAGTRIRFEMRTFAGMRTLHAVISEPEPGRRLVERYPADGMETTFTFDRDPSGAGHTLITIDTRYLRGGLRGWIERLLVPPFLRTVFRAELALLARQANAQRP
jgi:uncharacterized protein YndB with AHSA1/START domain